MPKTANNVLFILLILSIAIAFVLNISLGSVNIPFSETIEILLGLGSQNTTNHFVILQYRLPKAITAIVVGSGLGIAGLFMQTLFRNPVAGPYVLGLSSGASLGVAICIMASTVLPASLNLTNQSASLIFAASAGSVLVMLCILILAQRVKDTMTLLVIGLMFGSFSGSIVSVLAYFAPAKGLQQYVFWGFGSLGNLEWIQIATLASISLVLYGISFSMAKTMDILLLGERYAKSMGIHMDRSRLKIILISSILAGSITAYVGPIAFIGLAIPHFARLIFTTAQHKILIPAVICCGSVTMLFCDSIAQVPQTAFTLPINAVTALVGAPTIIGLLIRKKRLFW